VTQQKLHGSPFLSTNNIYHPKRFLMLAVLEWKEGLQKNREQHKLLCIVDVNLPENLRSLFVLERI